MLSLFGRINVHREEQYGILVFNVYKCPRTVSEPQTIDDSQNYVGYVFRLAEGVKAAEKNGYTMFCQGLFGEHGFYTVDDTFPCIITK